MDPSLSALLSSAGDGSPSPDTALKPQKNLGVTPVRWRRVPIPSSVPLQQQEEEGQQASVAQEAFVVVSRGSVVDFRGDAIVNAANVGCQGGAGVDGAINDRGGPELRKARENLPVLDGDGTRCRTGSAVCTIGGNLPAKWCIHAVGPIFGFQDAPSEKDQELSDAYKAAMERAREVGAKTVAFALLSAGIFRGARSLGVVLRLGIEAIQENLYPGLEEVHMVAFNPIECRVLDQVAQELWKRQTSPEAGGSPTSSSSSGLCCRRRAPPKPSNSEGLPPSPGQPGPSPPPASRPVPPSLAANAVSPSADLSTKSPPSGASPTGSTGHIPSIAAALPKAEI